MTHIRGVFKTADVYDEDYFLMYLCVSGGKICWFFGNFCLFTKWTIPFSGTFIYNTFEYSFIGFPNQIELPEGS